jgi:hypothetical protein
VLYENVLLREPVETEIAAPTEDLEAS